MQSSGGLKHVTPLRLLRVWNYFPIGKCVEFRFMDLQCIVIIISTEYGSNRIELQTICEIPLACCLHMQGMTGAEGYVWFLPYWFTQQWWDTDRHNEGQQDAERVSCTSLEMLSAVQSHFYLNTAFLGPENSYIVGNTTVGGWFTSYLERMEELVSAEDQGWIS